MLQIQHLTVTHRRDLRVLLSDFTFALQSGDRAALIGEEGNGKSTLLRLLYREELVRDYIEYTGAILKNGENPGYLPQELTGEQKSAPVSAFCAAAPAFYDHSPRELASLAVRRGWTRRSGTMSGPWAASRAGERYGCSWPCWMWNGRLSCCWTSRPTIWTAALWPFWRSIC